MVFNIISLKSYIKNDAISDDEDVKESRISYIF